MLLADAAETFVPVVGILVLFGLPITYAIISRYLAHQESVVWGLTERIVAGLAPRLRQALSESGPAAG